MRFDPEVMIWACLFKLDLLEHNHQSMKSGDFSMPAEDLWLFKVDQPGQQPKCHPQVFNEGALGHNE